MHSACILVPVSSFNDTFRKGYQISLSCARVRPALGRHFCGTNLFGA